MRFPEALRSQLLGGTPEFRRIRVGLLAAAFLAPLSATHIAGPITVGRAVAIFFAALLGTDLILDRPRRFRPDLPAIMLIVGYVGLCGWVFISAATWGCNCEGKVGGLFELTVIGLLAVVAIGFEPRLRGPAMVAAAAGLVLASALALGGVGSINSGTVDLTTTGGRLSGTYGNANEMGLAAALAIPVALAYYSVAGRGWRLAIAASVAILVATLVLTYSRGGIIAAGVGVVAIGLWEARGSRRRIAMILAGAALTVALGAGLYSVFKERRESVSFGTVSPELAALGQRDASGWDSRALGPIPAGPSDPRNTDDGIEIGGGRPGEGLSYVWGEAAAGSTYTLWFKARAAGGTQPLDFALADRVRGQGASGSASLDSRWRAIALPWRPPRPAPHAALFVWRGAGNGAFEISDVHIESRQVRSGAAPTNIEVPDRLRGSIYAHLMSEASRSEEHYVHARLDAARLAFRAFRSSPLRGIGWATFPTYSSERLEYGRLAAHVQYLLIAAELGLVGLIFLGLLLVAPILGARRAARGRSTTAAVGLLCGAAVGMVFVETLAAPQLGIPIALAAAVLCCPFGAAQTEGASSRTATPPPSEATSSRRSPRRRNTVA